MKKKLVSCLISFTLLSSLSTPLLAKAQENTEDIKGSLVIAGGGVGTSNHDVYEKFLSLAGGKEKAKVGIIPAASTTLQSSKKFKEDLVKYGVNSDSIKILPVSNHGFSDTQEDESAWKNQVNDKKLSRTIKGLTAVWFVGGDQTKIVDALRENNGSDSEALKAIWDIYRKGAVIGGTSAGAAMMSDVMITGGDSLGALQESIGNKENKHVSENQHSKKEYEPLSIQKGLGFFQHGIIDQHMDERARLGRLAVAAYNSERDKEKNFAYGVDEDTAMVVNNKDEKIEVVGRSGVAVLDMSKAKLISKQKGRSGLENIKVSYLSPGDKINYHLKSFEFPKDKVETKGFEYYSFNALPATGVFTPYGRLRAYLSYSLVDNKSMKSANSYVYDSKGSGYKIAFQKDNDTNGYWRYTDGQKDDYSIVNVRMDITPKIVKFQPDKKTSLTYKKSTFSSPESPSYDPIKGNLLIAGGALGSSNSSVYNKFINLAGGKQAKIGIVPAASTKFDSSNQFKADLVKYGVKAENIEILPISNHDFKGTSENESNWKTNINSDKLAQKVKGLTGIWFVGGDQTLITGSLRHENGSDSKVLQAIWHTYKNGAVLGGTSAGAAIMSNTMLAGGDSYGALSYGFTNTYDDMTQQEGGPAYLEKGLGFFQYGLVDQHFDNKARLGRLIATAYEKGNKNQLSYGIDEDTAMVVNNKEQQIEVVGRGGITLVDLAKVQANNKFPSDYKNILISCITSGDKVNLTTKEIVINPAKTSTRKNEYYSEKVGPNTGLFSPHGVLRKFLAYDLVDNAQSKEIKSYAFNQNKGFELTFRKSAESNGYWAYTDGQKDDYSIVKVALDIKPIKVAIK
ncbi:cyanophycinase [Priestia megaterium]|uniref:cyanophycinase n=1 Tax=Priestia megaterium TaxID=1404 RepID=UPI0013E2D71C|nr:cyanophycinase [Priestia megaterium]MED3865522.1 cyanophycinase [Priestia megaterium]MED4098830.1 cyanophycinase [Priestia megaterium]MED4143421.1 cyanophycinase [Priestia megaterium]MED4166260.1 cyanophycinase [Priestia megaterium]MED4201914.1 cyanophycinase [Priestia megaterium]